VSDIDVCLRTELRERLLETGVLPKGLDEGTDGVQARRIHLVGELPESAGRKALLDPRLVLGEVELRITDQEVIWTKPIEWREPGLGSVEVLFELVDVRRGRGNEAPAKDSCSPHAVPAGGECASGSSGVN